MYRDETSDGDFEDPGDLNLYFLQDRIYNIVALTDTDGAVKERAWYEPYGKATVRRESDGQEQGASFFDNPYLFQGRRWCTESSLYYFRNRDLSPTLGRFVQRDPVGYVGGVSLYEFVSSAPSAFVDLLGLAAAQADDCEKSVCRVEKKLKVTLTGRDPRPGTIKWLVRFTAKYSNEPPAKCKNCTFVLYAKGYFRFNIPGREKPFDLPHILPGSGKPLSATEFRQDSPRIKADNCKLNKIDHFGPHIKGDPRKFAELIRKLRQLGATIDWDIHFKARILDNRNKDKVVQEVKYRLRVTGTLDKPQLNIGGEIIDEVGVGVPLK